VHIRLCGAIMRVYRALWSVYRTFLMGVFTALLTVCRAVMSAYRALWGYYESI